MKVLLVHPHKYEHGIFRGVGELYHPLGLLYIASVLRSRGHRVRLYDEYVDSNFEAVLEDFKPNVLGLSVTSPLMKRAKVLTEIAKSRGATVILGGPHITAMPEEAFLESGADAVIAGEGEFVFADLLESDWDNIAGLTYAKNGRVCSTGRILPIEDLDSVPFPARDLCDPRKYRGTGEFGFFIPPGERWFNIISSRGCPYNCSFCASPVVHGHKVRNRSVENTVAEMVDSYRRWGVRNFTFLDDTFTLDEERTRTLAEAIRQTDIKFRWSCFTRVGVARETLQAMKKAGCILVSYGVEGGAELRRRVHKRVSRETIIETFRITREVGIRAKAYFMVGVPGESEEDYEESISLAKELCPDYLWVAMFYPLAGTPIYKELEQEGTLSRYYHPGSFFLTTDPELMRKHRRFLRDFYLAPRYLIRTVARASLSEWLYMLKAGRAFVMMRLFSAPRDTDGK